MHWFTIESMHPSRVTVLPGLNLATVGQRRDALWTGHQSVTESHKLSVTPRGSLE